MKHAKTLKYWLLRPQCYSQYILLLKCLFRSGILHNAQFSSTILTPRVARQEHEHSARWMDYMEVSKQTGPTEIMFDSAFF